MHCYCVPCRPPSSCPRAPGGGCPQRGSLALSSSVRFGNDGHQQEFGTKQGQATQPQAAPCRVWAGSLPLQKVPSVRPSRVGSSAHCFSAQDAALSLTGSSGPPTTFANSACIKRSSNYPFRECRLYLASILTSRSVGNLRP